MRRCCQTCHFPKFRGDFREFAQRHIPKGKTRVRCADISLARCLVSIFWVMDSKALCAAQFSSFVGTLSLPFFHIPNHFRATKRHIPERVGRAIPGTFGFFGVLDGHVSRSIAPFRDAFPAAAPAFQKIPFSRVYLKISVAACPKQTFFQKPSCLEACSQAHEQPDSLIRRLRVLSCSSGEESTFMPGVFPIRLEIHNGNLRSPPPHPILRVTPFVIVRYPNKGDPG